MQSHILTTLCWQRRKNCWTFWDMSIWALPTALRISSRTRKESKWHINTCRNSIYSSFMTNLFFPPLNSLSSGSSFSSASLSMFWHQPSIRSTSVCRRRRKNSPSLMHGEARPESGRLRGPSRDGVPAQALSEVMGRGEWERGGKCGCWWARGSAGQASEL